MHDPTDAHSKIESHPMLAFTLRSIEPSKSFQIYIFQNAKIPTDVLFKDTEPKFMSVKAK